MNRLLLFIFVFCQGFCAFSASTWDGGAGTNNWCDANNWSGNTLPNAGDDVTIGIGFTVVISSCNALSKKLTIDGSLTINSGRTLTTSGDVGVGVNNNDAEFINEGTIVVTGKFKAEGNGLFGIDGPYVTNNGSMSISDEINIGPGSGGGMLTNSGTITVAVAHIDGSLCNTGTISATTELKVHGGEIDCGGNIETPLIEFDDNNGRDGSFGSQNISDGLGCSGGGVDAGVTYNIKNDNTDYTFQTLIDGGGTNGNQYIFTDPANFTSCGENTASVLPVELLYFKGASNNGLVELSWSTATEVDNDYFEVESSKDGIYFTKIGEIKGNGTTNDVMKYSFVDDNPLGFENYYRLKQVDYDGQFEVFNTIMVLSTGSSNIKIYPNPTSANSKLVVQVNNSLEPDLVSVELSDLSGRILQKRLGYDRSFEFSTAHLTKGTYLVRVSMNRIVRTSKVLVIDSLF